MTDTPEVLAIIPARFASTRFPGKVIAPISGRPVVVHVYENTKKARLVDEVLVATDDSRVADALHQYGASVVMTRSDHMSGTDRIAEVAGARDESIIINVQGDEPLIEPDTIDAVIRALLDNPTIPMSTARRRITDMHMINDPNVVKVVCDTSGKALYFSRSPIPHIRDTADRSASDRCYWQHLGLYAYRRDFLLQYAQWPATPLEKLEKLEQLRVLENGYEIVVVETGYRSIGVDTPEDLDRVRAMLEENDGE